MQRILTDFACTDAGTGDLYQEPGSDGGVARAARVGGRGGQDRPREARPRGGEQATGPVNCVCGSVPSRGASVCARKARPRENHDVSVLSLSLSLSLTHTHTHTHKHTATSSSITHTLPPFFPPSLLLPLSQTHTQAQLASIDARLTDTEADNQRLAVLIDQVEQAFAPILDALQAGAAKELCKSEKRTIK